MKILYISPENTVGTLNLWKLAHEARGNVCQFITMYPSRHKYDPGICLNLPLVRSNPFYIKGRHHYYQFTKGHKGDYHERAGYPPVWEPNSFIEKQYFQFRDWLWSYKVEPAINKLGLLYYDIYHFEWGMEFYRDGRFVKKLIEMGKPIICTYHGQDLRIRGVIPDVDDASSLNMTSELDLLQKHPNIKYLFLPYDTSQHKPKKEINKPIKICHSPTNRFYKGSKTIIPICEELNKREDVEFILIENKTYSEVKHIKKSCDILIDQVHNRGGWGYGMNSVEALSMGLCCVTELVPEYMDFIPDHPFVNVTGKTLYKSILNLIEAPNKIMDYKKQGRNWVVKYHDIHNVAKKLYQYYNENNWI